jgi:hypothetical protein
VDAHGHIQIPQVVLMLLFVAFGVVLVTDSGGLASRMLHRLREQPVVGRLHARTPVWAIRAFGAWAIVAWRGPVLPAPLHALRALIPRHPVLQAPGQPARPAPHRHR